MCHQTPLGDHGQGDKTNPVYRRKERRCQAHIETNIKSIKKDRLLLHGHIFMHLNTISTLLTCLKDE